MSTLQEHIPPKLQQVIDDFALAEGQEKLDLLLEFARQVPELPERLRDKRDTMEQVHECMTPVFVYAELEDGGMRYYFDIPPEAPTIRGYAGLLSSGVNGTRPEEILHIPLNFYEEMGLQEVLSPRRLNGVHAMLAYIKRLAHRELINEQSSDMTAS